MACQPNRSTLWESKGNIDLKVLHSSTFHAEQSVDTYTGNIFVANLFEFNSKKSERLSPASLKWNKSFSYSFLIEFGRKNLDIWKAKWTKSDIFPDLRVENIEFNMFSSAEKLLRITSSIGNMFHINTRLQPDYSNMITENDAWKRELSENSFFLDRTPNKRPA